MPHAFPLFITTRNIFFKVIKIPLRGEIYVYQAFYYRKRVFVLHVIEMSDLFYWHFCTSLIKFKVIIMQQGNEHF